ncbi:hypothetical protein PF005_g4923 [Phytophthora fragariae]|uniref:Uncharacterized protein n=1 Tax=Phytophthora fragariae TaxID=53985 RepID=A0A6A3YZA4_9STRA|nr:hypothetical protein PF003_g39638 [Phytophthora fragariae]KAE8947970.1 hypothetical protein PF009_g2448 [Phytophthora fragariae]KAE9028436.1 hypothetical protein PF011_g1559 [Phytophthora fragariae]KAE9136105.1 hypothetical protein PF007_g2303 [Phytophthora fragariae]KAE9136139.1 hypothetical protein PF010_g1797 [Phytophthora fragariae]
MYNCALSPGWNNGCVLASGELSSGLSGSSVAAELSFLADSGKAARSARLKDSLCFWALRAFSVAS